MSGGLVTIDFTVASHSFDPAVAALGGGGAIVVYEDEGASTNSVRVIDSAGTVGAEQTALQGTTVSVPDIAVLADGRSLIVATSNVDNDIAFRFIDAAGAPLGVADLLDNGAGDQQQAAIAAFGNSALAVYQDNQDGTGDIMARFYDGTGETAADFVAEVIVGNAGDLSAPDVAALTDGRFIVVWVNGDNDDIEGRIVDAVGNPIGSVFTIDSSGGDDDAPRVAALPNGGFIVTWANDGGNIAPETNDNDAVLARRFDSSGAPAGDLFLVNSGDPATTQLNPAIAVNRTTGQAFFAWQDNHDFSADGGDDNQPDIRGRAFQTTTDVINGTVADDIIQTFGLSETINGLAGDDLIFALAGDDVIHGGAGFDQIKGGLGKDQLFGDGGEDLLKGEEGNDLLVGGRGRDVQIGGTGRDTFDFNKAVESRVGANHDLVKGFSHAQHDKINLQTIDADTTAGGNQAFDFIGGAVFTGAAGELRLSAGLLLGDTNGNGIADFEIKVTGIGAGSNSDFVL